AAHQPACKGQTTGWPLLAEGVQRARRGWLDRCAESAKITALKYRRRSRLRHFLHDQRAGLSNCFRLLLQIRELGLELLLLCIFLRWLRCRISGRPGEHHDLADE